MPLRMLFRAAVMVTLATGLSIQPQAQIIDVDKTWMPDKIIVNKDLVITAEGSVTFDGEPVIDLLRRLRGLDILRLLAYVADPTREIFSSRSGGPIMAAAQSTLDATVEDCIGKLIQILHEPGYEPSARSASADLLEDILKLDYYPPKSRKVHFQAVKKDAKAALKAFRSSKQ